MLNKKNIVIVGAGAWGTALSLAMSRTGHCITLMPQTQEHEHELKTYRENKTYFPNISLDPQVQITIDAKVFKTADVVLWVIPAQYTYDYLNKIRAYIPLTVPIVICSKGIDCTQKTVSAESLLSSIIRKILPNSLAVLSGPNFAAEIAQNMPAAATLAADTLKFAQTLADILSQPLFQLVPSEDLIGVQVTGAVKNVLAIACGLVIGQKLGQNALAAVITQGLAEICRLGVAMGGKPDTFSSLAGIGDLMLTCSSAQSRNTSLGLALAEGQTLTQVLASRTNVTEGLYTAQAIQILAHDYSVPMPICRAVYNLLYEGESVDHTLKSICQFKT